MPWSPGRPRRFPGLGVRVTTAVLLYDTLPRGPLHVCSGAPTPPAPCVSGLRRDCCFLGIWVWDVMGGSRAFFAEIHPKATHDPESLGV